MVGASLTIIIPVFNAESTLAETLESINDEIKRSPKIDWKIIAIDDGSTDSSVEILEAWKLSLPLQVEVIEHSGNPARPRNLGIELSNSTYVFFLDADDFLLPNGLSSALALAEANGSDVVLPRLKSVGGRGVPRGMYTGNLPKVTIADSRIYWALNPMKLIRLSLLADPEIRFDQNLRVGEDQPFSALAYLKAKTISVLSSPAAVGYRYTDSRGNLTLKSYPPEDYFKLFRRMVQILDSSKLTSLEIKFLAMRHWEIEFARELFWKSMPIQSEDTWRSSLIQLNEFASDYLSPDTLKQLSIRWRGIIGLIATDSISQLESLLKARRRVLQPRNHLDKVIGNLISNWIRIMATTKLPKNF